MNAGSSTLKFSLFDAGADTEFAGRASWGREPGPRRSDHSLRRPRDAPPARRNGTGRDHGRVARRRCAVEFPAGPRRNRSDRSPRGPRWNTVPRERAHRRSRQGRHRSTQLAPLHNPPALAAISAAQQAWPQAAHVAVFDTAFFANLAPQATIYPLPYDWYLQYGIRRSASTASATRIAPHGPAKCLAQGQTVAAGHVPLGQWLFGDSREQAECRWQPPWGSLPWMA